MDNLEDSPSFLRKEVQNYQGPVLIYDMDAVRTKISALRSIGNQFNCRFLFALKACNDPRLIRFFAKEGIGFDVSNQQELSLVRTHADSETDCTFNSLTGPNLNQIQDFSNVNAVFAGSSQQWEWLRRHVNGDCLVGVRISCPPRRSYTPMGQVTRFGIRPEDLSDYTPQAIHVHQSGGKTRESYNELAKLVEHCISVIRQPPKLINFGGGAYWFSIDELTESIADIRKYISNDIPLLFEFGDYWFSGFGYAIGQIIDRSSNDESNFSVTLDLSKDCHLHWSNPIPINALPAEPDHRQRISIYGSTCYEGDYIGTFSYPENVQIAPLLSAQQHVILRMVSIYSAGWNTSFNGTDRAKIVFHNL